MIARSYSRVSTAERETQNSTILNQRSELMRYAGQMAVDLELMYEDDGISGKIPMEKRPAGKRLLDDIAAGRFNTLLVYKIDRLGRETLDSLQVARRLKKMGVRLVSITEPFDTSGPMGEFVFTLFASVAQMEHANILERTQLGRLETARRGEWVGGRLPYGYTVENKRLTPHPTQAPVVRRLFQLYLDGTSSSALADLLDAEALPGPAGGDWDYQTINRLLQNRLYTGEAIYRKWRMVKENGAYAGWERQPEENHIRYEVPAIITIATFEAAERRRKGSPRTGRRAIHYPFLLSSLVRCITCDATMHGQCCRKADGGVYPYYRCRGCHLTIRADRVDDATWDELSYLTSHPEQLSERLLQANAFQEGPDETEEIERQIAAKEKEEDRVRGAFRRGIYSEDELAHELYAIRRETQLLKTRLEEARSRAITLRNFAAEILEAEELLKRLQQSAGTTDHAIRRGIVQRLILGVRVYSRDDIRVDVREPIRVIETGALTPVSLTIMPRAA